jgi:hypothetical protein
METLEFLRAWRMQIDTPEKWTRGCAARLANDTSCHWRNEAATKWCLLGAYDVTDRKFGEGVNALLRVEQLSPNSRLSSWNDAPGRTHAEVMNLLDKAIAESEEA